MARDKLQDLLVHLPPENETSRRELIECVYERLRFLARKLLHQDFPRLDRLHQTTSVVHDTVVRLLQALTEIQPATVGEFFALAIQHMRWALLDMAARLDHRGVAVGLAGSGEDSANLAHQPAADIGEDPLTLALWTEFHRKVEELPPDLRAVVDFHWYMGLSQAETARRLGLHPKEVSRRWIRARLLLAKWVAGLAGPMDPESESHESR